MIKKKNSFSGTVEEVEKKYRYGIQKIPKAMEKIEVPVIAAINGPAIGAGLDLFVCVISGLCLIRHI